MVASRLARATVAAFALWLAGCAGPPLEPWHTVRLGEEYGARDREDVRTFADYLALEERLFRELDERVYARVGRGPEMALVRFSPGSAADPRTRTPDWNRSFELAVDDPRGGVLLLHGMSDAPYTLRAIALALHAQGHHVVGLRLPGHGTAPSALRWVDAESMRGAVALAVDHLAQQVGDRPLHFVGYSTGAALALDHVLDGARREGSEGEDDAARRPRVASLVLVSPAVRIHPTAALASFKARLSALPGLGRLAWLSIRPEFDPYKYNSFATRAGAVVHDLTASVGRRLRAGRGDELPPILVLKSAVDATVTTEAVVDDLLGRLPASAGHELVLFDIDRSAANAIVLVDDPGPFTRRLMERETLPFALTLVTNASETSRAVEIRRKPPEGAGPVAFSSPGLSWPDGVVSLSHVAVGIPPDDPLYGAHPPEDEDELFLGDLAIRGERGLLALPAEWLLRMRYNPFYDVAEASILSWVAATEGDVARTGETEGRGENAER